MIKDTLAMIVGRDIDTQRISIIILPTVDYERLIEADEDGEKVFTDMWNTGEYHKATDDEVNQWFAKVGWSVQH